MFTFYIIVFLYSKHVILQEKFVMKIMNNEFKNSVCTIMIGRESPETMNDIVLEILLSRVFDICCNLKMTH